MAGSEMLICVCTFTTTLWESPVTRFTPSALGSLYVVGTQLTVVAISTHLAVDTNTSLAVTLGAPVITRTQNTTAKWTTSIYFTSKPWQIRAIAIYKQIFTREIWASETKGRYREIIISDLKEMEKQKNKDKVHKETRKFYWGSFAGVQTILTLSPPHTPFKRQRCWHIQPPYNDVRCITNSFLYPSNSKIHEKESRYNETLL